VRSWGVEMCLSIIGLSQVMSPLPTWMRVAALHHTGVVLQLTMLWATVPSTTELVLGHLPRETSWVEVMNELTTKF
jgi:hypothetical protein